MKRNQGGYTLVELLVTIVVGSLVTFAATTVLLLGLRINNRSTQTVIRQNTARVVITMLENLAAEGEISKIEYDATKWAVKDADGNALVSYDSANQTICTGSTSLVEGVTASHISLNDKGVLTFSMEKDEVSYNTAVYCRTLDLPNEAPKSEPDRVAEGEKKVESDVVGEAGRLALLNVLSSQYRLKGGSPNPGLILNNQLSTGEYYSEWYVGGYDETNKPGWGPETPWCACFVSWALCYPGYDSDNDGRNDKDIVVQHVGSGNRTEGGVAYANVDSFASYFENPTGSQKQKWFNTVVEGVYHIPTPGDIIFFDWSGKRTDPAHVGVVLKIEKPEENDENKTYVYTIEGNSAGIVAVRKYAIDDPVIMGYGVIDWTS